MSRQRTSQLMLGCLNECIEWGCHGFFISMTGKESEHHRHTLWHILHDPGNEHLLRNAKLMDHALQLPDKGVRFNFLNFQSQINVETRGIRGVIALDHRLFFEESREYPAMVRRKIRDLGETIDRTNQYEHERRRREQ